MSKQSYDRTGWLGKYRNIIISIALFLILDASVLSLNFYTSFQISKDAIGINLAGRQRMLSQRTTKALLQLQGYQQQGDESKTAESLSELKLVRKLFDATLTGFTHGGQTTGADGQPVQLEPVEDDDSITAVQKANELWAPYLKRLNAVLDTEKDGKVDAIALRETIDYAVANNLTLLKYMNDLTVALEHVADGKAKFLRLVQTTGIVLALLNFFLIMFHFLRQLRESDTRIEAAQRETGNIMRTVREGLFLVDDKLNIGHQYSTHLSQILHTDNIAGRNLEDLMFDVVSSRDMRATQTFIKQLFNSKVVEELIAELNPLDKVRMTITDVDEFNTYWLNFGFSRVYEEEEIIQVLVSVSDITESVLLEQRLEKEREQNNEQVELLASLLYIDENDLTQFTHKSAETAEIINQVLREDKKQNVLQDKLKLIFREAHSLKGEASALNLKIYTSLMTEFEEQIKLLQSKPNLVGNDFLSLTVILERLMSVNDKVTDLQTHLNHHGNLKEGIKQGDTSHLSPTFFVNLVAAAGERNGKDVKLTCRGVKTPLSEHQSLLVKDIAVQCLRNAVVHGIEAPDKRLLQGKEKTGKIMLSVRQLDNKDIELVIEDDGRGIDFKALQKKAEAANIKPKDPEKGYSRRELVALMFNSGVSTAENTNEDAGRGVGSDVIRERIHQLNGRVKIHTLVGKCTKFTILFPAATQE